MKKLLIVLCAFGLISVCYSEMYVAQKPDVSWSFFKDISGKTHLTIKEVYDTTMYYNASAGPITQTRRVEIYEYIVSSQCPTVEYIERLEKSEKWIKENK
jgi:hypothetical protein